MGTLTVRISDDIERTLRRRAAQIYGAKKGTLSRAIEEAIKLWISSTSSEGRKVIYRAFRGDELVAEASNLMDLADELRKEGEPVRGMRIVREPAPPEERQLGLRIRRATT